MTDTQEKLGADVYLDSATHRLDVLADALFGDDWAALLANMTGVSVRTCQRLRAAARVHTEHAAANGVLKRTRELLAARSLAADPNDGRAAIVAREAEVLRRPAMNWLYRQIINRDDGVTERLPGEVLGPFRAADLQAFADMAGDLEYAGAELANLIVNALNEEDPAAVRALLLEGALLGQQLTSAFLEVTEAGKIRWLTAGQPVFGEVEYQGEMSAAAYTGNPGWDVVLRPDHPDDIEDVAAFVEHLGRPFRRVVLLGEGGLTSPGLIAATGEDDALEMSVDWTLTLRHTGIGVTAAEIHPDCDGEFFEC